MDEELEKIRKTIDDIDRGIVDLLEQRVEAAKRIGAIKKKKGLQISDAEREKKVLENALKRKKNLDAGFVSSLFKSIIDYCKDEERR